MLVKYGAKKIVLPVELTSTINALKKEIETSEGVPMLEQRLIFSGRQLLEGEKTLQDCGLSESATILLLHQINNQKSLTVYVRTIQRELDFKLTVALSDTVSSIRTLINQKVKLPENYSLVYNGIVLADNSTVLDYGLRDRSSVYIVTQIVMEVENVSGERVKMRINDTRITGEVVERLVEQRRAVKKRKHASREERKSLQSENLNSSNNSLLTTTTTTESSLSRGDNSAVFSGLRRGFLNNSNKEHHSRKRSKTTTETTNVVPPPTSCAAAAAATTTSETVSSSCCGPLDALSAPITKMYTTTQSESPSTSTASTTTQTDNNISISPMSEKSNMTDVSCLVEQTVSSPIQNRLSTRCFECKKKLGITGIKCRCSQQFCGAHRYPEEHKCSYDYKKQAKEDITKANPKIEAPKISPIPK